MNAALSILVVAAALALSSCGGVRGTASPAHEIQSSVTVASPEAFGFLVSKGCPILAS